MARIANHTCEDTYCKWLRFIEETSWQLQHVLQPSKLRESSLGIHVEDLLLAMVADVERRCWKSDVPGSTRHSGSPSEEVQDFILSRAQLRRLQPACQKHQRNEDLAMPMSTPKQFMSLNN